MVHELQELQREKSGEKLAHGSRAAMQTAENDDERVLMGKSSFSSIATALQGKQLPGCSPGNNYRTKRLLGRGSLIVLKISFSSALKRFNHPRCY